MLVVHPTSTCDVCLDNYSSGVHSPLSIPCGHVFCQGYVVSFLTTLPTLNDRRQYSCIDSLPKPICPLCRTGFEGGDIRRLHIDRGQSPRIPVESLRDAHRYQTDITRIVKQGAPASKLRALIDECHIWLKSQPHDQVIIWSISPFMTSDG
jgi:RING-type zinc-finger